MAVNLTYSEWSTKLVIKTDPSDYAVYTETVHTCLSVQTIQHFNRHFFLHKMKPNTDNGVEILDKNITI